MPPPLQESVATPLACRGSLSFRYTRRAFVVEDSAATTCSRAGASTDGFSHAASKRSAQKLFRPKESFLLDFASMSSNNERRFCGGPHSGVAIGSRRIGCGGQSCSPDPNSLVKGGGTTMAKTKGKSKGKTKAKAKKTTKKAKKK